MGATYSRGVTGIVPDPASDDLNLASLSDALPQILARESPREIHLTSAHRAIRMTSESRLPLIGPVANPALLAAEYPRMMRRRYQPPTTDPVYPPGLYLSAAWGSRGLTNAPLGGEILAALICGEPLPLQAGLYRAIHPARSLVRALKRRPRNSPAVFHGET
jgi:tRNA 5-methylaminomethyl-2-thiouridine biosynthesis bifunctional protein